MSDEAMNPQRDADATAPADPRPADLTRPPDSSGRPASERPPLDLDRIERDLAGVEAALGRLDDGTYWTDEVTGRPIPDDVLAADPVARRAG